MTNLDMCLIASGLLFAMACASLDGPVKVPGWQAVEFIHRGYLCTAPCDLPLYVRVEPQEENRELWVSCAAVAGMERTSAMQLDERSPASHRFLFLGLSEGDYDCRAVVLRSDGSLRVADTRIKVVGKGVLQ